MPKKMMCHDCEKRPVSKEQKGAGGSLCEACADWAGWDNEHNDNAHQEILDGETLILSGKQDEDKIMAEIRLAMENCPICQEYPHPRDTFKAGHKNTVAKSYTSHAECDHPRTPKAREICRRARRKESAE